MNLKDAIKDAATKWGETKEAQFVWDSNGSFVVCKANEKPSAGGQLIGKIDTSGAFVYLDG